MPCPHASFIAITGTPVGPTDKDAGAVFGDYIIASDIQHATSWPGDVRAAIPTLGAAAFATHGSIARLR